MNVSRNIARARSGENVFFHGGEDIPFPIRTDGATYFKKHELEQLVPVGEYHAKLFDMAVPEEQQEYIQKMTLIVNKQGVLRIRDKVSVDGLPKIWLEWVEYYYEQSISHDRGNFHHETGQWTG